MSGKLSYEEEKKRGNRAFNIWFGAISIFGVIMVIWMISVIAKGMRKSSGFLDYMPSAVEPCPSYYRCGATSREQVAMENRLFVDLREGSKYSLPETLTPDEIDVIASEAEPTNCMLARASCAYETPMEEGQYTPYDEIESGMLARKPKKPMPEHPIQSLY